ncbi:hypothetical protein KJK34_02815 [Flavobacterium sp. D11R37]|uniref:hypothetical protein n=1 Tax=Flavobacterium coralii TaxID=2838017 RepID=UPI001CA7529A|nr:hypothetical protein [Flavobacterium coralii]MBY8961678.1 hypothetical protein [Flavobacterium coralii]
MKILKVFTAILLSSSITVSACGFYPFGEDVRYCFFKPEYFGFTTYSEFNYTANYFEPGQVFDEQHLPPNDEAWFNYCEGKVPVGSIHQAVYEMDKSSLDANSDNLMVQYLYAVKDFEAIQYLRFAKECELANAFIADPWERNDTINIRARSLFIYNAMEGECMAKNPLIKERYLFLAIRLAFYDQDFERVREIFDSNFKGRANKGIVYYYSLYFRALAEEDPSLQSFMAAQVFANAPDKRFVVYGSFDTELPLDEVLQHAQTNEERANVYLLSAIHTPDRALSQIKGMYANNPHSEGLDFLLLREMNKIEDWVYTPYYSMFEPSVTLQRHNSNYDDSVKMILQRVPQDRQYAQQLFDFINSANLSGVYNPQFWQLIKAQLEFVCNKYSNCLTTIKKLEHNTKLSVQEQSQLEKIKALALTARQPEGSTIIEEEIKPIIFKHKADSRFLFSLGRELEYRGNTTDAALLYSHLDASYQDYIGTGSDNPFWKSKSTKGYGYVNYFTDYSGYIDAVYTPGQLKALIQDIEGNHSSDTITQWQYSILKNRLPFLYDYLGMKYIRQDRLAEAASSFRKAGTAYWQENYSAWETGDSFGNQFDANPFYQIKYTSDFIPVKDKFSLNKYSVTRKLIQYLNRANSVAEKDRDYYYFLAANCYYNMTDYGNAWMMRRTSSSAYMADRNIEDEKEYRECNLATYYYGLALKHAKTDKFRALCLRMQAKCAENKWSSSYSDYYYGERPKYVNPYYEKLEKNYPQYYKELAGNCTYFEDYFKARR